MIPENILVFVNFVQNCFPNKNSFIPKIPLRKVYGENSSRQPRNSFVLYVLRRIVSQLFVPRIITLRTIDTSVTDPSLGSRSRMNDILESSKGIEDRGRYLHG